MQTDLSNTLFHLAACFVRQTNQHIFLTGRAGTGKTTFLKYIRQHCSKKMAVVAPTGVAAINAGGVTIHSFFQLPFGIYVPEVRTVWGGTAQNIYNRKQLEGKLRISTNKKDLIKELDLLVIDEVSMVRADVMDAIDIVLKWVRRNHEPFGGVQLLLIGDLYQLPPVIKSNDWQLMGNYYESPFFFDAISIKKAMPVYIELEKIYRQSDIQFIDILNNIRNNTCTYEDIERLLLHYRPNFHPEKQEGYITLSTHNYKADVINQQELDSLPGQLYKLEAFIEGEFPEHAYPVDKCIYLKEGAQIMFIKNDLENPRRYYNGKIGKIESIEEDGKKLMVSFPNQKDLLRLDYEKWTNIRYQYDQEHDEIKEEELGSFMQYPIRLAWAVTIHKSQGLTFEKAIVDAGQSFAPGQVYVALSRLTNIKGLVLHSRIKPSSIMTDERVINFSKNALPSEQLVQILKESQLTFTKQSLMQAYQWDGLLQLWQKHIDELRTRSIPDKEKALAITLEILEDIHQQSTTSETFRQLLDTLFQQGNSAYATLHSRTQAAATWFGNNLEKQVIQKIREHIKQEKNKNKTKSYLKALETLLIHIERKKQLIEQTPGITEALAQSMDITTIMERVDQLHMPIAIKKRERKKSMLSEGDLE